MKKYKVLLTEYRVIDIEAESMEDAEARFMKGIQAPANMFKYQIFEVEDNQNQ